MCDTHNQLAPTCINWINFFKNSVKFIHIGLEQQQTKTFILNTQEQRIWETPSQELVHISPVYQIA